MECLKGYIGIKGCGAPAPPAIPDPLPEGKTAYDYFSSLFINQLPGINLKVIEDAADDEQENYIGVWKDVETRALLKYGLAVKSLLNECYDIADSSIVDCLACENKKLFSVSLWYFLGVELLIEATSTDRLTNYTTIDYDKAEKLKEEFYTEFQASLRAAVHSLKPSDSDCVEDCIDCGGPVRWVMQTP